MKRLWRCINWFQDIIGYATLAAVALLILSRHPVASPLWWTLLAVLLLLILIFSLPIQRDHPSWLKHTRMALLTALAGFIGIVGQELLATVILLFVLSADVAAQFDARRSLAWVIGLGIMVLTMLITVGGWHEVPSGLAAAAGYFFFREYSLSLAQVEAARQESDRLLTELQEAHRQLQTYAERIETLAVAEERNRLSREMHDTLGHRLTVSIVQLEGASRLIERDTPRAAQMITTVREQLVDGLEDLRRTLAALRYPVATGMPLSQALEKLVADFARATELPIHTHLPAILPELSEPQRTAIYRTAQEALTNVQRHAQASQIWLALDATPERIQLTVRDNGRGLDFAPAKPGIGLRGLRERAMQLQGTLEITSQPGEGTQLKLQIPLRKVPVYG